VARLFDYEPEKLSLEDRMEEHGVPGLSVSVIDDGEIDWSGTWGVRDAATRAPVTWDTVFEAGSTSKLAAATLVMMLVEEGLLSLDDPVNDRLESWKIVSTRCQVCGNGRREHVTVNHAFPWLQLEATSR
jgi:CubicO group peptidase (beta-lactamase class C family)